MNDKISNKIPRDAKKPAPPLAPQSPPLRPKKVYMAQWVSRIKDYDGDEIIIGDEVIGVYTDKVLCVNEVLNVMDNSRDNLNEDDFHVIIEIHYLDNTNYMYPDILAKIFYKGEYQFDVNFEGQKPVTVERQK